MYVLEDRKRAVELYLKYGRHAAPVIRELGYPDYKSLVAWVKEYEETGTLREKGYYAKSYTREEKQRAVDFYLEHGCQISYTVRTLGYPCKEKLMEWIDELAPGRRIIHERCLNRDKHPSMEKKKEWDALEAETQIMRSMIEARLETGMTQKQLSEKTGINQSNLSRIERGTGNPSVAALEMIAAPLGKRAVHLLHLSGPSPSRACVFPPSSPLGATGACFFARTTIFPCLEVKMCYSECNNAIPRRVF